MPLTALETDFQQLRLKFQEEIINNPVWKDLLTGSVGQTLVDFISGIGAVNSYAIERALQDAFLDSANDPMAVLTAARMLGARIRRKVGGRVLITITRSDDPTRSLSIPPYSQFLIGGNRYFVNDQVISFPIGVTALTNIQLREGREILTRFEGSGDSFQSYFVGSDFTCDDELVRVKVANTEYRRVIQPLWNYMGNEKLFRDSTTQIGEVEILFGNGDFGYRPSRGANIEVYQYQVTGSAINEITQDISITCQGFTQITGKTTSGITGGDDELGWNEYRYISPQLFSANFRAVTRRDHESIIYTYPNVLDVQCIGEHEGIDLLNPPQTNIEYFNRIGVYLIMDEENVTWDDDAKREFLEWFEQYRILTTYFTLDPVTPIDVDFRADILVFPEFSLETVESSATSAVIEFFKPKRGHLGRKFYVADLAHALKQVEGIRFVTLLDRTSGTPLADLDIQYGQYYRSRAIGRDINVSY